MQQVEVHDGLHGVMLLPDFVFPSFFGFPPARPILAHRICFSSRFFFSTAK